MCFYWKLILGLQIDILLFVCSIRGLYLGTLFHLLKWYFALDKYNYVCWATIYCFDIASLHLTCPDVLNEFVSWNFSFLKTKMWSSRMALDQLHEQNNKYIKGVCGATNLVYCQDDTALICWELCGPDLSRLLIEFDEGNEIKESESIHKHHEDNFIFQNDLFNDVDKLSKGFICNPFQMQNLTVADNTEIVFDWF